MDQHQGKAQRFLELHQRQQLFLIPNPWDLGSARVLEMFGFEALASSSAGFAFSQGQPDNGVTRDQVLKHLTELSAGTSLPLSADFENGFGKDAKEVNENYRLVARTGVVGASIEDTVNDGTDALFPVEVAAERVRAAKEAVRDLGYPLLLTGRCELMLTPRRDLKETIARLQKYQEAGADVLFAPGLKSLNEVETVVSAVDRPVNVLMGTHVPGMTAATLEKIGVRRVSVGAALARTAWAGFLGAARELKDNGTFSFCEGAVTGAAMGELMRKR
jgi:2-methylisocitrate lyase-like PEP mutase family enzyme